MEPIYGPARSAAAESPLEFIGTIGNHDIWRETKDTPSPYFIRSGAYNATWTDASGVGYARLPEPVAQFIQAYHNLRS